MNRLIEIPSLITDRILRCSLRSILVFIGIILVGCESDPIGEYAKPGGLDVITESITVTDTQRERSFRVSLWRPEPLSSNLPIVIHSHGLQGSPSEMAYLAEHLASHGYVVVAPEFPHTSRNAGDQLNLDDILNQPGDVIFLIDAALGNNDQFPEAISVAVDPNAIALTGHSYGGMTSLLTAYDRELRDDRIKAVVPIAAGGGDFMEPLFYTFADVPMLWLHGTSDALIDYQSVASTAFENARKPKYLLTIQNGSHLGFGTGFSLGDSNPDALACNLAAGQDDLYEDVTFYTQLYERTPDTGIGPATAPLPCEYEAQDLPGISVALQNEITKVSVLAFLTELFSADLDDREAASAYLQGLIRSDYPDIAVDFDR